jgi:predicted RNase H-like HicB family nuclease
VEIAVYQSKHGYWVAECPLLPGCIGTGPTREEAESEVRKAIQKYIITMQSEQETQTKGGIEPPDANL